MHNEEVLLNDGSKKFYSELTEEEVRKEIKYFINHQLYTFYRSIVRLNEAMFKEDCIDYIYSQIKDKKFNNRKYFFVFVKSRLMDFYRKVKADKLLENSFKAYILFIDDFLELDFDESCCLLYLINSKFKKYIFNDKFARNDTKNLDFRKMDSFFKNIIKNNKLYVVNKEELKKYIIFKYEEVSHLYDLSEVYVVGYDDEKSYNIVENEDEEYNMEDPEGWSVHIKNNENEEEK